ncbi:MAG TPA: hypothetical protein VKZ50_04475 [bacterium]|nr:hypothetical protein [bacterium]
MTGKARTADERLIPNKALLSFPEIKHLFPDPSLSGKYKRFQQLPPTVRVRMGKRHFARRTALLRWLRGDLSDGGTQN